MRITFGGHTPGARKETIRRMENNLTSGSVFRNILRFSLPYLLSYLLQTLYGLADLFIIGQFDSVTGTTAVSIGSQVMHMLTVMIVGLAMGTTVNIGQAVGKKDTEDARRCIGNSVTLFMVLSVVLMCILIFLVRPIVSVMSTPKEAADATAAYLIICFAGIPFITAYNIISSIFRGLGDSRHPMYFIAVACAANIALDCLFMGPMRMGPAGAALGTTLAQAFSVAVALLAARRFHMIDLHREDLHPAGSVMHRIVRIGLPIALQDGLIQVAFILITIIANRRGLVDSAAVGIVEKIISFLFLVPSSMLSTVSALGAQSIGAGQKERARKTLLYAIMMAAGFGAAVSVLMQFIAPSVVGLFTGDAAVTAAGGEYLRGYIFDCIFAGIHFSFSGYFCAVGRSELSFLHNIIAIVLVRVPGVYLTSVLFPTSLLPMGLATAAGSLVSVIICCLAFALLGRKERREQKNRGE